MLMGKILLVLIGTQVEIIHSF